MQQKHSSRSIESPVVNFNSPLPLTSSKILPSSVQRSVVREQIAKKIAHSTLNSFIVQHLGAKERSHIEAQLLVDDNTMTLADNVEPRPKPTRKKMFDNNSPLMQIKQYGARLLPWKEGTVFITETGGYCGCFFKPQMTARKIVLEDNILKIGDQGDPSTMKPVSKESASDHLSNSFSITREITPLKNLHRIGFQQREDVSLILQAESSIQAKSWITCIEEAINKSYGKIYKLSKALSDSDLTEKEYVIEEEFYRRCDSGDIILFQDTHTFARIQRAATASSYDHVGIILKNRKGEVIIFQVNSKAGVAFTFWSQFLRNRWYNVIPRMAWRRLDIQRTPQQLQLMEDFVESNVNKQFELNLQKFWKFTSNIKKTQAEQDSRTYFCSELAAAFLKHLGLLDPVKSCTQYWPVDFSDARKIQILSGNLQHERVLVFQKELLSRRGHLDPGN